MNGILSDGWNKTGAFIMLVFACAGLAGCVTTSLDDVMRKQGYRRATREEMLRPTRPSFPLPEARTPLAAMSKERLIGRWTSHHVGDSRTALLSQGYDGASMTMTFRDVYTFFDDGLCKIVMKAAGQETSFSCNWEYRDGVLSLAGSAAGKPYAMDYKILWYGEDEFEMRLADVSKYEEMARGEHTKSIKCRYEPNGVFHTESIYAMPVRGRVDESALIVVESPKIFERDNAEG